MEYKYKNKKIQIQIQNEKFKHNVTQIQNAKIQNTKYKVEEWIV